ncbi:MAG: hypothetical protein GY804_09920 [Alphaproteobacteria bacterium]|nr:hypothetical protein [Alphaproteobacteria bacterium]
MTETDKLLRFESDRQALEFVLLWMEKQSGNMPPRIDTFNYIRNSIKKYLVASKKIIMVKPNQRRQ